MRERGDYVIPYFNNHYRFDKPPLTYWFQILSYRVFGENDFAARFPSAVAAALVAVLLLAWGQRLENVSGRDVSPKHPTNSESSFSPDKKSDGSESRPYLNSDFACTGWWAAIIFTLCLQTFMHAKAAVADIWLVLFVTMAHWAGYELLRGSLGNSANGSSARRAAAPYQFWWWIFYLSLAFAFLAKGPIGWTPLLAIGATKLFRREPALLAKFKFVRGITLALAVIALWGVPALIQTHGDFFRIGIGHHVIGRSLATMEGHGPKSLGMYLLLLPFYFVTVFVSFFPWSVKLPWLTQKLSRGRDAIDNYLIIGTAIVFLIFTFVKTKLPHYTLPAFPLLSLLLARHWSPEGAALSKAPAAAEKCRSQFKRIAIVTACVFLAISLFAAPLSTRFFLSAQLFQVVRNDLRPEMEFAAIGYNEPSLVWYFRSRVNGFLNSTLDSAEVSAFMAEDGGRFVILPVSLVGQLYPTLPRVGKAFLPKASTLPKERASISP